jgi:hypothetical protein
MSTMEPDEGTQADDQQADAPRWEKTEAASASDAPRWERAADVTDDAEDDGSDDSTDS